MNRKKSGSKKLNYAVVGLGSRSAMYTHALLTDYREHGNLVAYCDISRTRMDYYNRHYAETLKARPVPTYHCDRFGEMLSEKKVDRVIVTSIDRTHHRYIIAAMESGCDVITEKPLTVDEAKCRAIIDAWRKTGRSVTVTFNYRYSPIRAKVRELLRDGVIGRVRSVHFEWLLNTRHGADYFRRWHRDKRNSGGLMVHKATHHFDLVNWWLESEPETVFGFGDLVFYGRENAEERGVTRFYERSHGREAAREDPWAYHLESSERLRGLYLEAENDDGYIRDQSVFGHGISIEDDMAVLVRYRNRATMTYHLTAYSPWEGYRVSFNGTGGRIEMIVRENAYVSGSEDDFNLPGQRDLEPLPEEKEARIVVQRLWKKPVSVKVESAAGGHGGGDVRLLNDLFVGPGRDPLGRAAGLRDGVMSIMTGICANRSFETRRPVRVEEMISIPEDL